jgi:hypothetical protein
LFKRSPEYIKSIKHPDLINMKIKLYFCAFVALAGFSTLTASAQDIDYSTKTHLNIGLNAIKPIGSFGDTHTFGIGGNLQVEVPVFKSVFVTANGGYTRFMAKDNLRYINPNTMLSIASVMDMQMIPVKLGIKVYPVAHLYIQGEAGITSLLNSDKLHTDRSALFTFAPQIGTQLTAGKNSMVDIGVRYERMKSFYTLGESNSFLGLTLAYSFGLK